MILSTLDTVQKMRVSRAMQHGFERLNLILAVSQSLGAILGALHKSMSLKVGQY